MRDRHLFQSLLNNSSDVYDAMDNFNRTTTSRWVKSSGPTDLYDVDLSYDRNSNITDVDDSVQTGFDWQYTYDDLNRLTRAQSGTLSGGSITSETRDQNWTLDHSGNWTHTDYDLNADDVYTGTDEYDWDFTHNKANEITQWDNQTPGGQVVPVYDTAGNLTDDKRDYQYVYDAFYRLVTVKDQSSNVKAEYKYNGLGHRISARYDETAPWYHYAYDERWRIVAMFEDSDAAPTEQFWYHNAGVSGFGSSSYIDETVLRERDTDSNGTLNERIYYYQNWHHDVVVLTDTSGSVSERANYNAYGEPIGTFTSINNRKGFAGYEIDPNLNELYHVRHRVLNSKLGIWIRRDPLGYVDGANLYGYVKGNPIIGIDPMGSVMVPPNMSDDECCDKAFELGEDKDKPGGVICCYGRKVACAWLQNETDLCLFGPGPYCDRVKQIHKACIIAHERTHFDDVECDPDGVYNPVYLPSRDFNTEETIGHCEQIRCLKLGLLMCTIRNPDHTINPEQTRQCEIIIESLIKLICKRIREEYQGTCQYCPEIE